jgi:membrane protease YdiL (CAAX protease family)
MNAMRGYRATVVLVWLLGGIAAYLYSRNQNIPVAIAVPVAAAFLLELTFYVANGFTKVREGIGRLGAWLPWALTASAVAPYLVYSIATGRFAWGALAMLVPLAGMVSFWYLLAPPKAWADALFLAWMGGVVLSRAFKSIYATPVEGLDVVALGQLMWIRLGVFAVLELRRLPGTGFGFVPTRVEWVAGLRYFALCAPVVIGLAILLRDYQWRLAPEWWWKAPATFLGIFFVVALSEEFFFRGMLQPWLARSLGATMGLVLTSLLFGSAHLSFRFFPNWKMSVLAATLGIFCGLAYRATGSIRSAMVTHALVVTVWRTTT